MIINNKTVQEIHIEKYAFSFDATKLSSNLFLAKQYRSSSYILNLYFYSKF